MRLRDALKETFRNWKNEIPIKWQPILDSTELDYEGVNHSLVLDPWIPIFPVFHELKPLGSPRSSHTFKALEVIEPDQVKVVIIGQDPYPDIAKATGQSFEQGDISDWVRDERHVSSSLKGIVQNAAASQFNENSYRQRSDGWRRLITDLRNENIQVRSPSALFRNLNRQGVLWLNTTLSISLFREATNGHQLAHRALWAPVVDTIIKFIVARNQPVVFVLWGGWARSLRPRIRSLAIQENNVSSIGFTESSHPVHQNFYSSNFTNPITLINSELLRLGLRRIRWT